LLIVFHGPADELRLQHLARQTKSLKQPGRDRVALLAAGGHMTQAIIDGTGLSRGFVQRWAYAYRDGGIDAVCVKPRRGTKSRLSDDEQQGFYQRLCADPTDADDGVCTLRSRDAQRILEVEFNHEYTLDGVYDLMHRIGLSCLRPRPRNRQLRRIPPAGSTGQHHAAAPAAVHTGVKPGRTGLGLPAQSLHEQSNLQRSRGAVRSLHRVLEPNSGRHPCLDHPHRLNHTRD